MLKTIKVKFIIGFILFANYIVFSQIDFKNQKDIKLFDKNNKLIGLYNINSKKYSGEPVSIAKEYLKENEKVFAIDTYSELRHVKTRREEHGNYVYFDQFYENIPVWEGSVLVNISKDGYIRAVKNKWHSNIKLKASNILSKSESFYKTLVLLKFKNEDIESKIQQNYVYYNDGYKMVWFIQLNHKDLFKSCNVIIDATTGEILFNEKSVQEVSGSGKVFKLDPVTQLRDVNITYQSVPSIAYSVETILGLDPMAPNGKYYIKGNYAEAYDYAYFPPTQGVFSTTSTTFNFS